MTLIEQLSDANCGGQPSAVAVGTFDGVHLGHQALLGTLRDAARERGLASVAVTFRQQPRSVVRPDVPVTYLCALDERLELMRSLGLTCVIPVDFDDSVRHLYAHQFVSILKEIVGMRLLVLGPGARMGHDQLELAQLEELGRKEGFEVLSAGPAAHSGETVSSSAVRAALHEGRMEEAAAMLGRPFTLTGTVCHGDKRGRELGYPTANLDISPQAALPKDGIYATWAHVDGAKRQAATSIGVRPTFGKGGRTVEAYILDFEGDLYGRQIRLEFVARLRDEVEFAGVGALVEQMASDVENTRKTLGQQPQ